MLDESLNIDQKEMLIMAVLSGDCNIENLQKHEYLLKSDTEYAQLFGQYEKIWIKVAENKDIPAIDVEKEWNVLQSKVFDKGQSVQKHNIFCRIKFS